MKSENIVCEEWKGYRPNMPVKVVGVSNGKITSNGNGVEIFKNLKDAQKKYSDLDPKENTKRFTWVMYDEIKGRDAGRFETWQAERMYSMEEQVFQDTMKEANFNARILPANLEDLEMKTLIVAIGSTVTGMLDKIKKNTGSNANPVSLQVIKGGDAIKSALKSKMDLKGKEALVAFFKETNKHFAGNAPALSSIVRKYKLKSDKYSGKVFAEQETKLRELVRGYLNYRRKNPGQGRKGVVQFVRQLGPKFSLKDADEIIKTMNGLVKQGKLPKHLAIAENKEGPQDPEIKDMKGTQPKGYYAGLKKGTKKSRHSQFKRQAKMSDDNPAAYKKAPGDSKKTKLSKHTIKFRQMFGDD